MARVMDTSRQKPTPYVVLRRRRLIVLSESERDAATVSKPSMIPISLAFICSHYHTASRALPRSRSGVHYWRPTRRALTCVASPTHVPLAFIIFLCLDLVELPRARWLEVAIEAGDPMASSTLATWYERGR